MAAIHDEGRDVVLTIAFIDHDDQPVVPTTAQYRVVDEADTVILNWTSISPLADSVDLKLASTYNIITNGRRKRYCAVKFTYGASRNGTQGYVYELRDLNAYP